MTGSEDKVQWKCNTFCWRRYHLHSWAQFSFQIRTVTKKWKWLLVTGFCVQLSVFCSHVKGTQPQLNTAFLFSWPGMIIGPEWDEDCNTLRSWGNRRHTIMDLCVCVCLSVCVCVFVCVCVCDDCGLYSSSFIMFGHYSSEGLPLTSCRRHAFFWLLLKFISDTTSKSSICCQRLSTNKIRIWVGSFNAPPHSCW